jgi:hypothetical protein
MLVAGETRGAERAAGLGLSGRESVVRLEIVAVMVRCNIRRKKAVRPIRCPFHGMEFQSIPARESLRLRRL